MRNVNFYCKTRRWQPLAGDIGAVSTASRQATTVQKCCGRISTIVAQTLCETPSDWASPLLALEKALLRNPPSVMGMTALTVIGQHLDDATLINAPMPAAFNHEFQLRLQRHQTSNP